MSEIHIFIGRSRRLEARNDRLICHRDAPSYYPVCDDGFPEELAFPKKRGLLHIVAIDSNGWGWDGVTCLTTDTVDLKDLFDRWVAKGRAIFGRAITRDDFRFASHPSGEFVVGRKNIPFVDGHAEWGRLLEWEHVLITLTKSAPYYSSLTNAVEAMKMLGVLWALPAAKNWAGSNLEQEFRNDYSYHDRMCNFTDKTLDEVVPIFSAIADARDRGLPSKLPPIDESCFRARKRLSQSLIGTLDLADFSVVDIDHRSKSEDIPNVRLSDLTNYIVSSGKAIEFRLNGRMERFEVFQGYHRYDGNTVTEQLRYIKNTNLPPSLCSPDRATQEAGVSLLTDVLDRLVACAKLPLNVFAGLNRGGVVDMAVRDRNHKGNGINVLKPHIAADGYIADKLTDNRGEPGVCLNIDLVLGKGWLSSSISAGYVRMFVDARGAKIDGVFPGFATHLPTKFSSISSRATVPRLRIGSRLKAPSASK